MKRLMMLAVGAVALAMTAGAKPGAVIDGYPAWEGAVDKNHISGRYLCPSDLRHKVTAVVELEANDALPAQLATVARLVAKTGLTGLATRNWDDDPTLPRDVIVVVSNRGGAKDAPKFEEALKAKDGDATSLKVVGSLACSIYSDVTFEGAPDSAGKRPFVYVMGVEGKEPIFSGAFDDTGVVGALQAIDNEKSKAASSGWKPFFGTLPEPVSYPTYAADIAKAKPLGALTAKLQADIAGKDEAKAKEAQILYDALEQTRSDIGLRIRMEVRTAPHRAYYDAQVLKKYWPREADRFQSELAAISKIPQVKKLAVGFCKVMAWEDPKFVCKNASDAKKIVAELKKFKKDLELMKAIKNPKDPKLEMLKAIAMGVDSKVDMLIDTIPNRLPEK